MKTRLLIFSKQKQSNNQTLCVFALMPNGFLADIGSDNLAEVAFQNNLTRHDSFDWSVGNGGSSCALFEYVCANQLEFVESALPTALKAGGQSHALTWMPFAGASKQLTEKEDRRFLLLAVQFVAAGSQIQDDLIASPVDEELLKMVEENLTPAH